MCDDALGSDPCSIWDESYRRARSEYACHGCRERIMPGQRYMRTACLFDGQWDSWRHCARCAAVVQALKVRMTDGYTTEMLDLDCGEIWHNPPPEIEMLAFALPGDA